MESNLYQAHRQAFSFESVEELVGSLGSQIKKSYPEVYKNYVEGDRNS